MRCELVVKVGKGEEVRSEKEIREEWRWRLDGLEKERLRDPISRLIVC